MPKKLRPPDYLDALARSEWRRVRDQVTGLGPLDRAALAAYCAQYSRWVSAEQIVAESGAVVTKDGKMLRNPYLDVADAAFEKMRSLLCEFGLTPAARSRTRRHQAAAEFAAQFPAFRLPPVAPALRDGDHRPAQPG